MQEGLGKPGNGRKQQRPGTRAVEEDVEMGDEMIHGSLEVHEG